MADTAVWYRRSGQMPHERSISMMKLQHARNIQSSARVYLLFHCGTQWQLNCNTIYTTGAVLDRIFIFVVSNPSIYTNMAAANCVVITNGGELLEQPISTNSVPRSFFPRVAIGCRLLAGVLIGGYMR